MKNSVRNIFNAIAKCITYEHQFPFEEKYFNDIMQQITHGDGSKFEVCKDYEMASFLLISDIISL